MKSAVSAVTDVGIMEVTLAETLFCTLRSLWVPKPDFG